MQCPQSVLLQECESIVGQVGVRMILATGSPRSTNEAIRGVNVASAYPMLVSRPGNGSGEPAAIRTWQWKAPAKFCEVHP